MAWPNSIGDYMPNYSPDNPASYDDLVYREGQNNAFLSPVAGQPSFRSGGQWFSGIEPWSRANPVRPMPGQPGRGTQMNPQGYGNPGPNVPPMNADYINRFLGAYGTSLPQQVNPNVVMGPGFSASHPRLAGGLDNMLLTLANMGQSDGTVGGGIQSIARGLAGASAEHRQNITNQVMAPFGMASNVAHIQSLMDAHNLNMAHQDYFGAMGDYHSAMTGIAKDKNRIARERIDSQEARANDRIAATRPVGPDPMGGMSVYNAETKQWEYHAGAMAPKSMEDRLLESENQHRYELGMGKMTAEEEIDFLQKYDTARSKGHWAGHPRGTGGIKMNPVDRLAYTGAQHASDLARKELDSFDKMKPSQKYALVKGLYPDGDTSSNIQRHRAELAKKASDASEAFSTVGGELQRRYGGIGAQKAPSTGGKRPPLSSFEGK